MKPVNNNKKMKMILAGLAAAGFIFTAGHDAAAQPVPSAKYYGKTISASTAKSVIDEEAAAKSIKLPKTIVTQPNVKSPKELSRTTNNSVNSPMMASTEEELQLPLNGSELISFSRAPAEVIVGEPEIADVKVTDSMKIYVIGQGVGSTNALFLDSRGNVIRNLKIHVGVNVNEIKSAIRNLLPNENIGVSSYRDSVFLTGGIRSSRSADRAVEIAQRFVGEEKNVVNLMQMMGSQQVIIQVRVAEMNRTAGKQLGVNLSLSKGLSFSTFGADNIANAFISGSFDSGIKGLSPISFKALEERKMARTLAEPTLTALSGKTASFLAGGEVPVPTGVDQNGNAVIEFREVGIRLNFTPVVQDAGRINLQIMTEVSSLGETLTVAGSEIPQIDSRNTRTTVDLPSGGSVMIAGLIKNNGEDEIKGTPGVLDLPILGSLFRSNDFSQDRTELVVVATAYLAKPFSEGQELTLPTDGFTPASDLDIYLMGRLWEEYTGDKMPVFATPVSGPFGYIME